MNLIVEEVFENIKVNYEQLYFEKSSFFIEPREYNHKRDFFGLDELDYLLLDALFSFRDSSILINEANKIELVTLAKKVYQSSSVEKYLSLILRLDRLSTNKYITPDYRDRAVTYVKFNENENNYFANQFSEEYTSTFLKECDFEWGEEIGIKIRMGSSIHTNFIKLQLKKVYKEKFDSTSVTNHDLLYFLLNKRAKAFIKKEKSISITARQLRGVMPPKSKNDLKNREFIKRGLNEVINTNVLNINYVHNENGFKLDVTPLTPKELHDLLGLESKIKIKDLLYPVPVVFDN